MILQIILCFSKTERIPKSVVWSSFFASEIRRLSTTRTRTTTELTSSSSLPPMTMSNRRNSSWVFEDTITLFFSISFFKNNFWIFERKMNFLEFTVLLISAKQLLDSHVQTEIVGFFEGQSRKWDFADADVWFFLFKKKLNFQRFLQKSHLRGFHQCGTMPVSIWNRTLPDQHQWDSRALFLPGKFVFPEISMHNYHFQNSPILMENRNNGLKEEQWNFEISRCTDIFKQTLIIYFQISLSNFGNFVSYRIGEPGSVKIDALLKATGDDMWESTGENFFSWIKIKIHFSRKHEQRRKIVVGQCRNAQQLLLHRTRLFSESQARFSFYFPMKIYQFIVDFYEDIVRIFATHFIILYFQRNQSGFNSLHHERPPASTRKTTQLRVRSPLRQLWGCENL